MDWVWFNFLGYLCYSVYYVTFRFNPVIHDEYRQLYNKYPTIHTTDVLFALHGATMSFLVLTQAYCWNLHKNASQYLSDLGKLVIWLNGAGIAVFALVTKFYGLHWLYFLEYLGLLKVAASVCKNVPQIFHIHQRQSTAGWPVLAVLTTSHLGAEKTPKNVTAWPAPWSGPRETPRLIRSVSFRYMLTLTVSGLPFKYESTFASSALVRSFNGRSDLWKVSQQSPVANICGTATDCKVSCTFTSFFSFCRPSIEFFGTFGLPPVHHIRWSVGTSFSPNITASPLTVAGRPKYRFTLSSSSWALVEFRTAVNSLSVNGSFWEWIRLSVFSPDLISDLNFAAISPTSSTPDNPPPTTVIFLALAIFSYPTLKCSTANFVDAGRSQISSSLDPDARTKASYLNSPEEAVITRFSSNPMTSSWTNTDGSFNNLVIWADHPFVAFSMNILGKDGTK
ncbi:hypothetical protein OGAPHI_005818 [Ogataea philodendri]|uniref:Uncharacterized protein n=1 Tax=Ogataea philodendri TaxID=1378263 RepID=A0A9P8T1I5_9ASCO|nr:uncharacterized protein OGAPHI_005818 [Ogataea philodendri]KAH3662566.1 hypothetical protein OGAPHI_005818 [Ogataea philodendri]